MNKKKWLMAAAAIVVLFGVSFYFRLDKMYSLHGQVSAWYELYEDINRVDLIDLPQEISQVVDGSLSAVELPLQGVPRTPSQCESFMGAAFQKKLSEWAGLIAQEKFRPCLDKMFILPSNLPQVLKERCLEQKLQSSCEHLGFYLRSLFVDWYVGINKDYQLMDISLLYHLANAKLVLGYDERANEEVAIIAAEMMKKDPRFYPGLKFKVFTLAMKKISFRQKPQGIEELFYLARTLNPGDVEIFELDVIYHFLEKQDEQKLMRSIETFNKRNPEKGNGHYLAAHYYWKQKDRARTKQELQRAIAKEELPRYRETLEKIEQGADFSEQIFRISLSISFDHFQKDLS